MVNLAGVAHQVHRPLYSCDPAGGRQLLHIFSDTGHLPFFKMSVTLQA
jgi:hypothetical protein